MSNIVLVEQTAADTPSANQVVLYPKSDGLLYSKDDAGTETPTAIVAATQAQLEAASVTTVYSSPGRQHFHPSAVKCWVEFQVDGTVVASYNVTSITDTGAGTWTVNIATDMSSGNYAAGASGNVVTAAAANAAIGVSALLAGSFNINMENSEGTAVDPIGDNIKAWAFGDQA